MRRLLNTTSSRLPHGWTDVFRQISLFVIADLCYETVRGIAEGKESAAFVNAGHVVDFEKATGTFFEPGLQSSLIHSDWLISFTNFMYQNSHFVLTSTFLVWLYLRRNDSFYFVRNMFMFAMGIALIGYTAFPTAPPRLLPEEGFIDTITQYAQVNHDSALVQIFINPFAAVPSMHCGFSLMIGATGFLLARHPAARVFWAIYPLLVFFVVVFTANHFWIDGALGWMAAGLSALGAYHLARYRPQAWSFRSAGEPRGLTVG
ncbi:MAG: phosphatase PAP2 family protein [Solirubrobacterales bacterium]